MYRFPLPLILALLVGCPQADDDTGRGADPVAHLGSAGLLVLTALVAGWLPVRRAARTDPAQVLRVE